MNYIYEEYFYVPKHEKIRDKVITTRLVMMVTVIIICLAAMSFSAYAYFTSDVSSSKNHIKTANFETRVFIFDTEDNNKKVEVTTTNYKVHTAKLKADTLYSVRLEPTENNTAQTGFFALNATGCEDTFHTQQLGIDRSSDQGKIYSVSFQLTVTKDTDLTLTSYWGTHSYYDEYINTGVGHRLYITNDRTGENAVKMVISTNAAALSEDENELTGSSENAETDKPTSSEKSDAATESKVENVSSDKPDEQSDDVVSKNTESSTESKVESESDKTSSKDTTSSESASEGVPSENASKASSASAEASSEAMSTVSESTASSQAVEGQPSENTENDPSESTNTDGTESQTQVNEELKQENTSQVTSSNTSIAPLDEILD